MRTTTTLAVLALALVPVAGCATTAPRAAAPRAADRFAHRVASELGGRASADLRLCVDDAGAVTDASVVRTSGIDGLDQALIADARALRFAPRPARVATACRRVAVVYTPR